jgi:hypothetical protein
MLTALSAIASAQAEPMEDKMTLCKQFLHYTATHQDAILTYKASNMVLVVHSDVSYLSKPKARSRAGGHFFLSSDCDDPANNGAVLNLAQLIKAVMSSAAEAELGALYINAREAVPQQITLTEMGHKQPQTPMQTKYTTALGVMNNNIQPRCTKAMDMRFHWLRCREAQCQFRFFLAPRSHQQSRLLDQASLRSPPHRKAPRDLNPQDCIGSPTSVSQTHPRPPTTIPTKHQTLTICTSNSSGVNSTTASYIEVLKGCVRYPLSNYEGIWNSHIESLPLRISGTWHSIMRNAARLPPPCKDTYVSCFASEHK